jgi:hypothetical protein
MAQGGFIFAIEQLLDLGQLSESEMIRTKGCEALEGRMRSQSVWGP